MTRHHHASTGPRGMPQQRRADLTVTRIMRGAIVVIREAPGRHAECDQIDLDGVSVEAIARAAGISVVALHL